LVQFGVDEGLVSFLRLVKHINLKYWQFSDNEHVRTYERLSNEVRLLNQRANDGLYEGNK